MIHYDAVVIGAGSMGSATCYYLAKQGKKVLGLEQFDIVHEKGSHTGQSRIIRKAYFEHPDYVPLLERAYSGWRHLEKKTDTSLFYRTGIVYFGSPDHETMKGIKRSAAQYSIPLRTLTPVQAREEFPLFQIPGNFETLVEADAGFVTPERAIALYAGEAAKEGATILSNIKVKSWKQKNDRIQIETDTGIYTCDKLIITAGSWTPGLVPSLRPVLKVTRQVLAWVQPRNKAKFLLEDFPCWFVEDPRYGTFYGFPVLPFGEPAGLKLALHRPGEVTDPDRINREVSEKDLEAIRYVLAEYIPVAGTKITACKTCLYTYSPDENFIIDFLPGTNKQVVIACGFSGHGFKFVPVVGEILADLAVEGKTDLPAGFLKLERNGVSGTKDLPSDHSAE